MTEACTGSRCCIPDAEADIFYTISVSSRVYCCAAVAGTVTNSAVIPPAGMEGMLAEGRRDRMTAAAGSCRRCVRGCVGLYRCGAFTGAVNRRDDEVVGGPGQKGSLDKGTGYRGNFGTAGLGYTTGRGPVNVI